MKLILSKPSYLKSSIEIINELVIESRLNFKTTGIELISMDAANIAMINFKLLRSAFTSYSLDKEFNIGIKLSALKDILKKISETDVMTIEFNDRLIITSVGKTKKVFKMPVIDIDVDEKKQPTLDYKCVIKTKSEMFSSAIDVCDIMKDDISISLNCNKERLKVSMSEQMNESYAIIKASKETKITNEKEVVAKFSKSYLKKFILGSKLSENVKIELKSDFPMRITYSAPDKASISFIIAPRVSED